MSAPSARLASAPAAACLIALLAWAVAAPAQDAGDVTIYRCTGTDGEVVIGNQPCPKGTKQEVRSMARPVDAPPGPEPGPSERPMILPATPPASNRPVAPSPQPLYECVRPDGSVYESDSGEGELRRVTLWTSGWPVGGGWHHGRPGHADGGRHPGRPEPPGGSGRGDIGARGTSTRAGDGLSAPPVSRISIPPDPPRPDPDTATGPRPRPPHRGSGWFGTEAGTWEADRCHALPQAEACARLRDRREDIRRRFFNAQQSERDTLRIEERGLNARIDSDCRTP
ncbi:DUF4124 domain-containing protein [Luteimonas granuli]|nr:DUF4124 domain-containing protein [Luteimonas granuli]